MNEILDKYRNVVNEVFQTKDFLKNKNATDKMAIHAYFWICRNFTDLKLREIAEHATTNIKKVSTYAKRTDNMYWENSYFCKLLSRCISKLPKYEKKSVLAYEPMEYEDMMVMKEISRRYGRKSAMLVKVIYKLSKFERISIKQSELAKLIPELTPKQVYRAYLLLLENKIINDTSKDFGVRSIKIIDKDLLSAINHKVNKPREKKDFKSKLPASVMEHVLALEEIRKNKAKKFGM